MNESLSAQLTAVVSAFQCGDPEAGHTLLSSLQPRIASWASRFSRFGRMEREDASQAIAIGVLEAARQFHPDGRLPFVEFALLHARRSCAKYAVKGTFPIQMSAYVCWQCSWLAFQVRRWRDRWGDEIAFAKLREALRIRCLTEAKWSAYCKARAMRFTSDFRRGFSHLVDSFEFDAEPTSVFAQELRETIDVGLAGLKPRQARLIRFRFGIGVDGRTLKAFGKRWGVTVEWVRQVQNKALKKLKAPFVERGFGGCDDPMPLKINSYLPVPPDKIGKARRSKRRQPGTRKSVVRR